MANLVCTSVRWGGTVATLGASDVCVFCLQCCLAMHDSRPVLCASAPGLGGHGAKCSARWVVSLLPSLILQDLLHCTTAGCPYQTGNKRCGSSGRLWRRQAGCASTNAICWPTYRGSSSCGWCFGRGLCLSAYELSTAAVRRKGRRRGF
jgi:hypothetical protein